MALRNCLKHRELASFCAYMKNNGYDLKKSASSGDITDWCFKNREGNHDIVLKVFGDTDSIGIEQADLDFVNRYLMKKGEQAKIPYLLFPLSEADIKRTGSADTGGVIADYVAVGVEELINTDRNGFLELISTRLMGTDLYSVISYNPFASDGGKIIFYVAVDLSKVSEEAAIRSCYVYDLDEYSDQPAVFMPMDLSDEKCFQLIRAFSLWYGNTDQSLSQYGVEYAMFSQAVIQDRAVMVNPAYLLLDDVMEQVCVMLPEEYRSAFKTAAQEIADGNFRSEWFRNQS